MIEAVEGSGLEVETFNAIGQAVQQDPELMQQVQEMTQVSEPCDILPATAGTSEWATFGWPFFVG